MSSKITGLVGPHDSKPRRYSLNIKQPFPPISAEWGHTWHAVAHEQPFRSAPLVPISVIYRSPIAQGKNEKPPPSSSLGPRASPEMESLGVLLAFPMNSYLEEELSKRCKLFRLWETPPEKRQKFLRANAASIRAVVGNSAVGADAEMIDALPALEIVASFSVGLDKVDLAKCRERGIRVTNTPDVLTDDVADLAIGLAIATMRRICEADRYVRSGAWKDKGDFKLTSKVWNGFFLSPYLDSFMEASS